MAKLSEFLVSLVLMCMLINSPSGEAIGCSDVFTDLFPCLSYINIGGDVPSGCCDGAKVLISSAQSKIDRQAACFCLKNLASHASDEQIQRAASIPGKCGVSCPFPISRDVDCSKVQ